MKKRVAILLVMIISILITLSSCAKTEKPLTAAELLDLGEKYLLEMDYEQAAVYFTKLIEVEPMNPRGYTGTAEAYIGLERSADAIGVLEQGYKLTGDGDIREMLIDLGVDEGTLRSLAPTSASGDAGASVSDDNNLTGQAVFSIEDLEAWGYPLGMEVSDILSSELYKLHRPNENEWSETIWVGTGPNANCERVLKFIQIKDDSVTGPRSIKVGMTYEEVVALFRCDNPDALRYGGKSSTENWINLYENWQSEPQIGQYANLTYSSENDGRAWLNYDVQYGDGNGYHDDRYGCSLGISLQDGVVSEIYMDYYNKEYFDFETLMFPNQENPDLVDFNNITFLGQGIFDIFNSDIFAVANIAHGNGFMLDSSEVTDSGSDHWYYSSPFSDWSRRISALQDKNSPYVNLLQYGDLNYTQEGKIGVGDIDMSDSLATVLSKWGFADGQGLAEYLLSFSGKPMNEFCFDWYRDVDGYRVSIGTYPSGGGDDETTLFDGSWLLTFYPTNHEGYSVWFRFDNNLFVEYSAHRNN